jgi:hypothetical protein
VRTVVRIIHDPCDRDRSIGEPSSEILIGVIVWRRTADLTAGRRVAQYADIHTYAYQTNRCYNEKVVVSGAGENNAKHMKLHACLSSLSSAFE